MKDISWAPGVIKISGWTICRTSTQICVVSFIVSLNANELCATYPGITISPFCTISLLYFPHAYIVNTKPPQWVNLVLDKVFQDIIFCCSSYCEAIPSIDYLQKYIWNILNILISRLQVLSETPLLYKHHRFYNNFQKLLDICVNHLRTSSEQLSYPIYPKKCNLNYIQIIKQWLLYITQSYAYV